MALNFPSAPSLNQTYTADGRSWIFNGSSWDLQSALVTNASISSDAAIAGTKIVPDFGSQTITTTGVVSLASGTVTAPGLTFTGDTDTGIYRTGSGAIAIASDGVDGVRFPKHNSTPATSVVHILPTKVIPEWADGTYNGYYSVAGYENSEGGVTNGLAYYGEKYTEVLSGYGRVINGSTYVDFLGIGDGDTGSNFPHYISVYSSRPDGNGYRQRLEIGQSGDWRTNYSDYPGLAANVSSSDMGPAFFCRAWVNFNPAANTIAASGNVSSLTDQGVGTTDVNLTTAMPDTNYAVSAGVGGGFSTANQQFTVTWGLILSSSKIQVNSRLVDNDGNTMAGTDQDPTFCVVFR
jgi:hypothetical protein